MVLSPVDGTTAAQPAGTAMRFERKPDENSGLHSVHMKAILVVDDDQQLAAALQWILAEENYLVDVAFDGEEAMLKVKNHRYDAVVCDLKMPRLRGDEFYLATKSVRPDIAERFIFITGFSAEATIHGFLDNHEVKYLVKPFAVEGLISCVKELLR